MARPLRIEYPGAFYHVTSRGNEQKDIFKSRKDRKKFLDYLESATERYGAVIHAFCLMNNHYHILLETPTGNLSQIMRHLNGSYTTYFNVKRKRAGHLFQGRYKAILVEADSYGLELSRYIHLNPLRAGSVNRPEEYEWSSYRHYIGLSKAPSWLKTGFVLDVFGGKDVERKYREFVNEGMKEESESPLMGVIASTILGSPEFVRVKSQEHLGEKEADRNMPALRILTRPTVNEIINTVEKVIGKDDPLSRKVSIYFCHRYSGARLKEIGERFGMSDAAITQASRRVKISSESDVTLRKLLDRVGKRMRDVCG
jgi:REP element-mobilizing transposase RayT